MASRTAHKTGQTSKEITIQFTFANYGKAAVAVVVSGVDPPEVDLNAISCSRAISEPFAFIVVCTYAHGHWPVSEMALPYIVAVRDTEINYTEYNVLDAASRRAATTIRTCKKYTCKNVQDFGFWKLN